MIVFFNAGQLGNQVFQYAFLDSIRKSNERIVTSYCGYFDIFNYQSSDYIFLNKYLRFILRRVLKLLAHLRIVTYVKQDREIHDGFWVWANRYTVHNGLFSGLKYVEGFFQSATFFKTSPQLKEGYFKQAEEFLRQVPPDHEKVFVHVRRGDYLDWSILGKKNPSLPLSYFQDNLVWFQKNLTLPFFIFLTDDKDFVEKAFAQIQSKVISLNSPGVDLAIMSLCPYGVTSNSTLSWWGSYLMKENKKNVFSPKYWLGWKNQIWYPMGIQLKYVSYKEVCEE